MKKILLTSFVIAFAFNMNAQLRQKMADKLYSQLAYYKAADLYEDLSNKKKAKPSNIRKTADCYRHIGNTVRAEEWYKILINKGQELTVTDHYQYAQMLKSNEKYLEANRVMKKVQEMDGSNSIALAHEKNDNYMVTLKERPSRYSIMNVDNVNTDKSDFGASFYKADNSNSLIFASARRNTTLMNKEFQWDGSNFLDIYKLELDGQGKGVSVEKFAEDVKSKYHEGPVSFNNDYTEMFLTRSNFLDKKVGKDGQGINNLKIFISKKEGETWGALEAFPYNSDDHSVGHAVLSKDGNTLYFVSDMEGSVGETDIWKSERSGATWTKPVNMGKAINTEGKEMFPHVGANGLFYFASDGHVGLGGLDLYRSKINKNGTVDDLLNMGYPLNTNYDDFALIVNDDETEGYFSSNRKGSDSKGDDDIYSVQILEPFGIICKGLITDKETQKPIPNATVEVKDKNGDIIKTVTSDENGNYMFAANQGTYNMTSIKEEYDKTNKACLTDNAVKGIAINDIEMFKPKYCIEGTITDAKTGETLEGAVINILDQETNEKLLYTSSNKGYFNDCIKKMRGDNMRYQVVVSKEGYFDSEGTYIENNITPGTKDLSKSLKFALTKKETGVDIGKLLELNPIYFDFNKYNIREDAAIELDKVVTAMNKYPSLVIELGSHTDCRGSKKYNTRLSDKRAKSSATYIRSKGIPADRIYGKGYGESKLINSCACEGRTKSTCSDEEHDLNRRTEFKVVKMLEEGVKVKNNSPDSFDK